jgi:hypothetical protein
MLAVNFESELWLQTVFGNSQPWSLFHTIDREEIKEDLLLTKKQRSTKRAPIPQAKREDFPEFVVAFINEAIPYPKAS